MVAKRKIAFNQENSGDQQYRAPAPAMSNPPKTVRRNARERNRVKQIDVGFEKLRTTIPTAAQQKKISRVKILASAVDYIQHLHTLISEHETVCRHPGTSSLASQVKQEPSSLPLPTPPKSSTHSPAPAPYLPHHHHHYPYYGQTGHPGQYGPAQYQPHTPMSPMSPMSPAGYMSPMSGHAYSAATPQSDPGYYSAHSPALTPRSTNTCHVPVTRVTPRGAPRDSLSPGSVYSDTSYSGQGHPPPPSVTQDPTPSSTFREEDELLDSIVQWEKY